MLALYLIKTATSSVNYSLGPQFWLGERQAKLLKTQMNRVLAKDNFPIYLASGESLNAQTRIAA
jgi:hypothetical protein